MSNKPKNEEGASAKYELIADGITQKSVKKNSRSSSSTWFYIDFASNLGLRISLPIAGGAILGKYLDGLWGSYPRATILLLFLGIIISMAGFVKTIREILKKK